MTLSAINPENTACMTDILIADSGASKIAWAGAFECVTRGYNAASNEGEDLVSILRSVTTIRPEVTRVYFFGAGISDDARKSMVARQLRRFFPNASLTVESDMVGAALSLCGRSPGVACILGTGANSCLWDGGKIIANTPALGYVIGDEGSGAVMGRNFIEAVLKHRFSPQIEKSLDLKPAEVISEVYRGSDPRRYLASFAPTILSLSSGFPEIRDFVVGQFVSFFRFNIDPYHLPPATPVNFTGGIAVNFKELLGEAARKSGNTLGRVVAAPIIELSKLLIP